MEAKLVYHAFRVNIASILKVCPQLFHFSYWEAILNMHSITSKLYYASSLPFVMCICVCIASSHFLNLLFSSAGQHYMSWAWAWTLLLAHVHDLFFTLWSLCYVSILGLVTFVRCHQHFIIVMISCCTIDTSLFAFTAQMMSHPERTALLNMVYFKLCTKATLSCNFIYSKCESYSEW